MNYKLLSDKYIEDMEQWATAKVLAETDAPSKETVEAVHRAFETFNDIVFPK